MHAYLHFEFVKQTMKRTLHISLPFTLVLALAFLSANLFAQDIAGIWKGTISTTDKQLQYELAITENNGKLTGYSYTTFYVKGVEMAAVKSIKVTNENGVVTVTDNDLIYNNFQDNAPKEIKQTDNLILKQDGEVTTLIGKFKTKGTRQFRPLSGGISLQKEKDTVQSKLIATLDSLQLKNELSFLKPKPIPVEVTVAKVVHLQPDTLHSFANIVSPTIQPQANTKKIVAEVEPVKETVAVPVKNEPATVKAAPKKEAEVVAVKEKPKPVVAAKAITAKPVSIAVAIPVAAVPKPTAPAASKPVAVVPPAPKAAPQISNGANFTAELAKRSIETIRTVYFKTDSLLLTLYDNGEVDGDTVSVILNGRMIMAKQGLSTKAITKTIYITPDMGDSLQLVMYAENLGSLPPNTGLLLINDGKDRYEIRFAGDLTKNAAIVLRRRTRLQ